MSALKIGGPRHMWSGQFIRNIKYDGNICASMPKKDSFVTAEFVVERNSYYSLSVGVRSNIDVKLTIELRGESDIQWFPINVKASILYSYFKVDFSSVGLGKEKFVIKIYKEQKIHCDVYLKDILISSTDKKGEIFEKTDKPQDLTKLAKQEEFGKLQNQLDKTTRIEKLNNNTFNKSTFIIGGVNFDWRGQNIRTVIKDDVKCADLYKKDSYVYAKVIASSESQYKIIITAQSLNGNGEILLNFFGNNNTSGSSSGVKIQGREFREYTVTTKTPKFTNGLPIYLRIWNKSENTGRVIIKAIQYIKTNTDPVTKVIEIQKNIREDYSKKASSVPFKRKKKIVEVFDMKYKPYDKRNLSNRTDAVFIRSPKDVPMISIITPTRDGLDLIKKCYNAIINNTNYPNWEWIVGDSLSVDGTVDYLKSLKDERIKIVEMSDSNGSFSSINNYLVKHASGEYLIFLNNDTEPQPLWIYNMISKIHNNPEIGIVGSKLLYSENKIQHCGVAFVLQGPANIGKSVLKSFTPGFADQDRFYQAVTAACLMVRKSDFEKVNGFGEEYWFCYEDIDLCLKIKNNLNKKILYSANSVVIHNESITQKKYPTAGTKQQEGIKIFKQKWADKIAIDFPKYQSAQIKNIHNSNISFVTCVNNTQQYMTYIAGSLFKNKTSRNYEIIPILNYGNKYSAAQALNLGLSKARSNIVVFCHQDVIFYEDWIETLFDRIKSIENKDKNWGVLGTAGITIKDDTFGVVYSLKNKIQWQQTKRVTFGEVQTVDEHCMIIRKSSGLKFDESFKGFHLYGPDICLSALSKGMKNYGILNPLVHDSSAASLYSGREEFMKWLNFLSKKWGQRFRTIRTPTSSIVNGNARTFIKFSD